MKLSVLMPVFNEENWLEKIVDKVLNQRIEGIDSLEVILVDDGSTDKTKDVIHKLLEKYGDAIVPVYSEKNLGKGSALKTAIEHMSGDICIIQDADLEYDPKEYPLMLEPIIAGHADCVYGSRFIGSQPR